MKEQTKEVKQLSARVYILGIIVIIALVQSVIKNYINERWAKNRDTVACVPETETHYPGVYIESAAHPINHDAKLKLFIEQYVHLTRDESIVDFHKLDKSGRYDKARLSDSKWTAIYMSKGPEKIINQMNFSKSTDRMFFLEREKLGLVFLIDEILLMPVPMSLNTAVIVRGQYESIYDSAEAKNKSLPPEFLGYKEIRYIVETSFPESNVKNDWENKDGFYVIWSSERDVPLGEATLLQRKSREKLIRNNN
jgi:hypothetical protein